MKRSLLIIVFFVLSFAVTGQVGISNTDPKASLDITATDVANPASTDGILIPRVDEFPTVDPGADQDGMMIFATGNGTPPKGFYYWDNATTWTTIGGGVDTQNTLDGAYDEGGAGAGRSITADNGALEIQGSGGLRVEDDILAGDQIIHDGDTDTFIQFSTDGIQLDAGGRNYMDVQHTNQSIVFNESSNTSDFRVESDNQQYMFFLDGSNNAIGIGQNNPISPLHVGIQTTFDLSYSNTGQDGLFLRGAGNNSGDNTIGSSIGFGPPHTARSTQRKAAIAAIQTSGDADHIGLSFYVHPSGINMSDMVEGMRLTHQGRLGLGFGNTDPEATLDVNGTIQFTDGNEAAGYVLSSDADGNATWTDPGALITDSDNQTVDSFGLSGDNLGISLENDGEPAQTADLSNLSFNVTNFALAKMSMSTNQMISSSYTKVDFDSADYDLGTNFNTTTDRFEVGENGMYRITASSKSFSTNTSNTTVELLIYVDGSAVKRHSENHHASGIIYRNVDTVQYLTAGQFIEVYAYASSSYTIDSGNQSTSFTVERIR